MKKIRKEVGEIIQRIGHALLAAKPGTPHSSLSPTLSTAVHASPAAMQ